MALTAAQLQALGYALRTASCLSLIGVLFILLTYTLVPKFRTPMGRLIFYTAFVNLFSVIATMIARSGLKDPDSGLCQFQGFLFQWAFVSDAYWVLAMSINVFLVFFRRFDTAMPRRLEPLYMVVCYGASIIPAITYLFVRDEKRGRVYGNATLFCHIQPSWNSLRFTMYGPAWFCIVLSATLFAIVGQQLLRSRRAIRKLQDNSWPRRDINVKQGVSVEMSSLTRSKMVDADSTFVGSSYGNRRPALVHQPADEAMLSYLRFAGLYFIALLVEWIPPTVNRAITTVRPKEQIFGIYLTQAILFSLQGFFNSIIYACTSLAACKELWTDVTRGFKREMGRDPIGSAAPSIDGKETHLDLGSHKPL